MFVLLSHQSESPTRRSGSVQEYNDLNRDAFQFLKEGIENAKKENKKVVVFTHHVPVIESKTFWLFNLVDTILLRNHVIGQSA